MLQPLVKKTIVDDIIGVILDMAVRGQLKPNERIPSERELAAQLCVSRTSVREALRALSFTGAIVIKPGDGTYFKEIPSVVQTIKKKEETPKIVRCRSEFRQISEARRVLEVQMAALAAQRATAESIAELEESIGRMREFISKMNIDEYAVEDMNFHNLLAKACQNNILYQSLTAVWQLAVDIVLIAATVPGRYEGSFRQHVEILDAVKRSDSEGIKALMERHMDYSEENINMYFKTLSEEE